MQRAPPWLGALACLACLLHVAPANAAAAEHPVTRVIGLLQALGEKVKQEGQAEEVTFAQFDAWCKSSVQTLQKAIAGGKESVDALGSKIEAKTRQEALLTEEIQELEAELTKHSAAAQAAQTARQDAASLYATADKELADTIAAITSALAELESAKTSTATSLVQDRLRHLVQLPLLLETLSERQLLGAPGGSAGGGSSVRDDILAKGSSAASQKKYDFKSGNVIELLKELKAKFEDDRVEGTKAETNAQNAYSLAKGARDSAVAAAGATKTEKTSLLGDTRSELSAAKAALLDAQADLKADSKSLADTEQSCSMKATEWRERTEIREREIKAIAAGVEILSKVTGVRTEKPSNPVPPPSPVSAALLLQGEDPRARAVGLLREEAKELHSRALAHFAEELAARAARGPFNEVTNMIQKMIFRLMAEQKDEDEHKNWCDLELNKTSISQSDKESRIVTLDAKLTDTKATIQLLTNEAVAADEMVAKITAHMKEATKIRQVGKAENARALEDANDAQHAIAEAQAVLLEFYKGSGMVPKQPWELLQKAGAPVTLPAEPSTWSAAYTGVADPAKQPDGIIAVLKTISADFATMAAETSAQEETDQRAYEQEMKSAEIEKARRAKESEMKTQERKRLEDKAVSLAASLKHVGSELEAVKQYLKDLGPACVEGDSTYEERKAARDKEIGALKQAQVMLEDWRSSKGDSSGGGSSFLAAVRPVSLLARGR